MKKRILCFTTMLLLMAGSVLTVQAEEHQGDAGWTVEFNGEKMESNFSTGSLSDVILAMQPGDKATVSLSLKNSADYTTDWYMTNEVLSSLEDSQSVANGGAYTYILTYTNSAGEATTLYSSEAVGGEKTSNAGEGLHEATDSLKDYLYLERLDAGKSGRISLEVALDGETQGNAYQDTLADLQMNFAVEKVTAPTTTTTTPTGEKKKPGEQGTVVQTGDTSRLGLWSAVALISGVVLLILAVIRWKSDRRERRMHHE
ncbi:sortase B protein-sorting domain-containing protein [Frisingicoccus sp.]|uniref:sortase B protein-sorting domain-containing protein n=1 Tax=Frisingicoccus sp. TaxID=1918627 RepID=UPI003AB3BFAB